MGDPGGSRATDQRPQLQARPGIRTAYWVLLDRWARLRSDWARWAIAEVATWPDGAGPRDRAAVRAMLADALDDEGLDPLRRLVRRVPTKA